MNDSSFAVQKIRTDFHNSPVGVRVLLPDGTCGLVERYQDTDQGRIYKIQGIHLDGRPRYLGNISCWFAENELRLVYHSLKISPEWWAA